MTKQRIAESVLKLSGQSQSDRVAIALSENYVEIDGWTKSELMDYMQAFAEHVNFYQHDSDKPSGNWQSFFPFLPSTSQQSIEKKSPSVSPHMALLQAFVELYQYPQKQINQLTNAHLDFYYKRVLRIEPQDAIKDKAHIIMELKKSSSSVLINSAHRFTAGKDEFGVERQYKPVQSTLINHGAVSSIRSIFIDPVNGKIKQAPIANSQDGLGGELTIKNGSWHGFGHKGLPPSANGFAISSHVLRLLEGQRIITIKITLSQLAITNFPTYQLTNAFLISLSGEKGWLEPQVITPTLSGNILELTTTIGSDEQPISPYSKDVHGSTFETTEPVMQIWVNQDRSAISYSKLEKLSIDSIQILTNVKGVKQLKLENDLGKLNAKTSFMPYSVQPYKGMRFYIGSEEVLGKCLSLLTLHIEWQNAPVNFAKYYRHYKTTVNNSIFKVSVAFNDSGSWQEFSVNRALFNSNNASEVVSISFTQGVKERVTNIPENQKIAKTLANSNQQWVKSSSAKLLIKNPILATIVNTQMIDHNSRKNTVVIAKPSVNKKIKISSPNDIKEGVITLSLEQDFLHEEYRQQTIKNALAFSKSNLETPKILNEPYTPIIASITLDYNAYTDTIEMDDDSLVSYANDDVLFFHLSYAGQQREHSFLRNQFEFIANKNVSLVPEYQYDGELLIGLSGLSPNESVSLLVTIAEGSAQPETEKATIEWSVLSDNYWKPLNENELVADATNNFLTSGIINIVIPPQATIENTILPSPNIWLKVGLKGNVKSVCDIIDIKANGVEVVFCEQINSDAHLKEPLAPDSIVKLKTPVANIKSISQPTASFGGKPKEAVNAYRTRTSERLRHKNRVLTIWDIERILLNEFPTIYKVKCLPHSKPLNWNSPGHITAIVIPNLYNQNATDPFQPKASNHMLSVAKELLSSIGAMQVKYHVINPRYYQVRIGFGVKFNAGVEFSYYSRLLNQKIVEFLTPWMKESEKDIYFGGIVYKSEVLDFVEKLPFVDYLSDFTLKGYENEESLLNNNVKDVSHLSVTEPDMIMVSAKEHDIYSIE